MHKLIPILCLCLAACSPDYCYKGHDEIYVSIDDPKWDSREMHKVEKETIFVCDEWRYKGTIYGDRHE